MMVLLQCIEQKLDPSSCTNSSILFFFLVLETSEGRIFMPGKNALSRKISTNKYYTTFRCDMYTKHLLSQHPTKWKEYELAERSTKEAFFSLAVPHVETLKAVFETESYFAVRDRHSNRRYRDWSTSFPSRRGDGCIKRARACTVRVQACGSELRGHRETPISLSSVHWLHKPWYKLPHGQ